MKRVSYRPLTKSRDFEGYAVFGISEQQEHILGMIYKEGEQGRVGAEGIQAGQT